jgi:hypothetical protein
MPNDNPNDVTTTLDQLWALYAAHVAAEDMETAVMLLKRIHMLSGHVPIELDLPEEPLWPLGKPSLSADKN